MDSDFSLDVLRFSWQEEVTMLARLAIAAVAGGIVGYERKHSGKSAGIRTLMLVSLGAALFTLVSIVGFVGHDPSRVASGVVAGIGFLGAGTILRQGFVVRGLTTAAAIWVAAAVGMAAGAGLYIVAIGAALASALIMGVFPQEVPGRSGDDGFDVADPHAP